VIIWSEKQRLEVKERKIKLYIAQQETRMVETTFKIAVSFF
jgi:hypothetical protein